MRILYNSKDPIFKTPFGTLIPGQECTLHIHIPGQVGTVQAFCVLKADDTGEMIRVPMCLQEKIGAYDIFTGSFRLERPALYFYYFEIIKPDSMFRLFKVGDDTNMEAGDCWQLTCVPTAFTVPDWAKGGIIYQIFPDRFNRSGWCDLTGKLEPYVVHMDWDEEVFWEPTTEGLVLNNDFYGGNFNGITEKMEYIASLGTTVLYLNPISKSFSSHRYDTGDYKTPDPMLGTEEDFSRMCEKAHQYGIRVILDGVFSHTGANSLYFDREQTFGGKGAYCSPQSEFYNWFQFKHWPSNYDSWWGFDTLPTANKLEPSFLEYILTGEDSVVAHWLNLGCDGFRLDVADELPNEFMDLLRKSVRKLRPDALVIGEVWEDASNKEAYGVRRRYFTDGTLDSVMNYPFRTAILNFMRGFDDGAALRQTVMTIAENYPGDVFLCNMNPLGTHDTPRILTALVDDFDGSRQEKAARKLSPAQKELALKRLYMASFIQYMLPGSPSLYYGDEAGMEGYADPFNRRTYPWGREDAILLDHYRRMGALRKRSKALRLGDIAFTSAQNGKISFTRCCDGEKVEIYVNHSGQPWQIPAGTLLYGENLHTTAPDWLTVDEMGFCIVRR